VRIRWLISIVVLTASAIAVAAPWKTTIEVVLRKKPGERQAVVAKLPAGTTVVIVKEEGRWLRVRAGRRIGYLTRTTVADTAPPATPPIVVTPTPPAADVLDGRGESIAAEPRGVGPSNSWSSDRSKLTRSGGTGLFVGVTATTTVLYAEARAGAAKIADAARGSRLAVLDATDPAWIHVRDAEGRDAWVARQDVDNATAAVAITGAAAPGGPDKPGDAFVRSTPGRLAVRAGAAIGYRSLGMDFTSNGSSGLANYLVSADASAADVDLDVVAQPTTRTRLGVDGRVQVSTSTPGPGIDYVGPSRVGGKIPFSTFAADAGVRIGFRTRRVFELALRGGIHYDAFVAKEVENAARLPREQLFGGTLGARVEITPPASRVSVGVRLDVLAIGKRGQTAGLEDGTSSSAGAVWAGATIRILLRRHLSLVSAYDFGRATTTWSGMSARAPGVTEGSRIDSSQIVRIGLGAEL